MCVSVVVTCEANLAVTSLQAESGTVHGALPFRLYRHGAGATRHRDTRPEGFLGRSHMVALGEEVPQLTGTQRLMPANTPFLARTTIPLSHRFPIPTWAPRSGRGIQFHKCWSAVRKLLAAFGLTPDSVGEEAPPELSVHG